jgi:hypothetical protein
MEKYFTLLLPMILLSVIPMHSEESEYTVLQERVYDGENLKELVFVSQVPDTSDVRITDISINCVFYYEGKNNIAYLQGLESCTWRGVDLFPGGSEELVLKFNNPHKL